MFKKNENADINIRENYKIPQGENRSTFGK